MMNKKFLLSILISLLAISIFAVQDYFSCFAYHRFGRKKYSSTNISIENFEKQLKFLKENNYNVISLGEALEGLKKNGNLPDKSVVLTIDDGYKSFYSEGFRLLKKYDFPATIFVNPGLVGHKHQMTWEQLEEVKNNSIEIGNHSAYHPYFLDYKEEEIGKEFRKDLINSNKIFKDKMNFEPKLYSYPFGEYNLEMTKILKEFNYLGATAQNSGVPSTNMDFFQIPRFPMGGVYTSFKAFKFKIKTIPLPVIKIENKEHQFKKNPPKLQVTIDEENLNTKSMQAFIKDSKGVLKVISKNPLVVEVQAKEKLSGRRNLYKITAATKDMKKWCWFSFLWIKPNRK